MSERVTHEATVADRTDEYVWFTLDGGSDAIEVPVPYTDPAQSSQTEQTLGNLTVGDHCRLTLVAANERNTAWCADAISVLPN